MIFHYQIFKIIITWKCINQWPMFHNNISGKCIIHNSYWCTNCNHSNSSQSLQWHHNEHDGISNHLHLDCLLNHLSRRRSRKTSKLCFTGLCEGNPPGHPWFPLTRGTVTLKMFPFDDVIVYRCKDHKPFSDETSDKASIGVHYTYPLNISLSLWGTYVPFPLSP